MARLEKTNNYLCLFLYCILTIIFWSRNQTHFSMMGMLQWAIRSSIEVEKYFTSIERLLYYDNALKKNAKKKKGRDRNDEDDIINGEITAEGLEVNYRPNKPWPNNGEIKINNLKMRKDFDLVLNGLNVHILPGEKVGIVSR